MGIFAAQKKTMPDHNEGNLIWRWDGSLDYYTVKYHNIEFIKSDLSKKFKSNSELDRIISIIGALKPELIKRINEYLKSYEIILSDKDFNNSLTVTIHGRDYGGYDCEFELSFGDYDKWGDLGVDFGIIDDKIIFEEWGD